MAHHKLAGYLRLCGHAADAPMGKRVAFLKASRPFWPYRRPSDGRREFSYSLHSALGLKYQSNFYICKKKIHNGPRQLDGGTKTPHLGKSYTANSIPDAQARMDDPLLEMRRLILLELQKKGSGVLTIA